jgi:15-cis-phytoene synthase
MTDALASAGAQADAAPAGGFVSSFLRDHDRDRWLSTLFAPAQHRAGLQALYAFNVEIARVRELVSDPLPGEMRYQWWRDVLAGQGRGDVESHPVASALVHVMARYRLPAQALQDLIEARTFDLYDDPMPGVGDLEGYCGETSSALVRLASLVLADGGDPGGAEAAGHAGVAYALTGLLRALPWHASQGLVTLPADRMAAHGVSRDDVLRGRDTPGLRALLAEMRALARRHLAETRARIGTVTPVIAPAFLPVALVEPCLALMERRDYDPFRTPVDLPAWRKVGLLWLAAWKARLP